MLYLFLAVFLVLSPKPGECQADQHQNKLWEKVVVAFRDRNLVVTELAEWATSIEKIDSSKTNKVMILLEKLEELLEGKKLNVEKLRKTEKVDFQLRILLEDLFNEIDKNHWSGNYLRLTSLLESATAQLASTIKDYNRRVEGKGKELFYHLNTTTP